MQVQIIPQEDDEKPEHRIRVTGASAPPWAQMYLRPEQAPVQAKQSPGFFQAHAGFFAPVVFALVLIVAALSQGR